MDVKTFFKGSGFRGFRFWIVDLKKVSGVSVQVSAYKAGGKGHGVKD